MSRGRVAVQAADAAKVNHTPNSMIKRLMLIIIAFVLATGTLFKAVHTNQLNLRSSHRQLNACAANDDKEVLIFTIINHAFVDFAKNWVLALEAVGMHHLTVVCTDYEAHQELSAWQRDQQHGRNVTLLNLTSDVLPRAQQFADFLTWSEPKFREYTKKRPVIIRHIYDLYRDSFDAILYLDADIVVVENFIPILDTEDLWRRDVALMSDGPHDDVECHGICSCFIFIPLTRDHEGHVRTFLSTWEQHCTPETGNDQTALYDALGNDQFDVDYNNSLSLEPYNVNGTVNVKILDCRRFPSGHEIQYRSWANNSFWNESDHSIQLIHANFMLGPTKQGFLKDHGLWRV